MLEKMVKFPLKDTTVVRVICHHEFCGGIIEIAASRLEALLQNSKGKCPLCGNAFPSEPGDRDDKVITFARALKKVLTSDKAVEIELAVAVQEEEPSLPKSHQSSSGRR